MALQMARLIGSAGSGKTTELIKIMQGALPGVGGNPHAIGLLSFTRAARQEAAERAASAWQVPVESLTRDGYIRTGHSVCHRQLGIQAGQMITDKKADLEWLANGFGVRLSTSIDDDNSNQVFIGDERVAWCLNVWNLHRVTLKPLDKVVEWKRRIDDEGQDISEVISVAEQYESLKRIDDRCDFSDLLLRFAGIRCSPKHGISNVTPEGDLPPVQVWLFDEQQDASPLLDAVCKRLISGPLVRWAYVVGDPFQSIYGFAGSSAECFLGWPVQKQRIMPKSYRCPAPILRLGEECLRRMTPAGGYFDRGVEPADHDGVIERREDFEDIGPLLNGDDDWLLIARTNYQASRLLGLCASLGIPARSVKAPDEPTLRQRGLAALFSMEQGDMVSGRDWAAAVSLLPIKTRDGSEMLTRGTRTRWKNEDEMQEWDAVSLVDLPQIGGTPQLSKMIASGEWQTLVDYGGNFRKAAKKYGLERAMRPRIRTGTIHSVKGMEADNVVVLTTTSKRVAWSAMEEGQHNEECRLAYVAVTRSKKRLVIVNEGGRTTPRMEALA